MPDCCTVQGVALKEENCVFGRFGCILWDALLRSVYLLGCGGGLVLECSQLVLFGRGAFLESLAVMECGFGLGSVRCIGVVGAGSMCRSSKG